VNLLLDTHVLLWWLEGSSQLGLRAKRALFLPGVTLWISAAVIWEITIKISGGLLKLRKPPAEVVPSLIERGFQALPIKIDHALAIRHLPPYHNDPFDRILVAQAQCEDFALVTANPAITAYDVRTIDASK
jgi:PIN domain nuclease of toxin-antitoxin system